MPHVYSCIVKSNLSICTHNLVELFLFYNIYTFIRKKKTRKQTSMTGFKLLFLFIFCLLFIGSTTRSRSGGLQVFVSSAESVDHQEQQVFDRHDHPVNATTTGFDTDKRTVPTGSNPLHNKRR